MIHIANQIENGVYILVEVSFFIEILKINIVELQNGLMGENNYATRYHYLAVL